MAGQKLVRNTIGVRSSTGQLVLQSDYTQLIKFGKPCCQWYYRLQQTTLSNETIDHGKESPVAIVDCFDSLHGLFRKTVCSENLTAILKPFS